jgi:hypothetical protein
MTKEDLLADREVLAKLQSRREQLETMSCEMFRPIPFDEVLQMGNNILDWQTEDEREFRKLEPGTADSITCGIRITVLRLAYTEYVNALLRIAESD